MTKGNILITSANDIDNRFVKKIYTSNNIDFLKYCIDSFLPKKINIKNFYIVDWFLKKMISYETKKIYFDEDFTDKIINSLHKDKKFYKGNILSNARIVDEKIKNILCAKYIDFKNLLNKLDKNDYYDEIILCSIISKMCKIKLPLSRRMLKNYL